MWVAHSRCQVELSNARSHLTLQAITQDNVTLDLDGVLYYKVIDPFKASYGVEDPEFAIQQLAQTTMRAEIGQMTLDKTLAERTQLNENIVKAINHASEEWGIRCLRYEVGPRLETLFDWTHSAHMARMTSTDSRYSSARECRQRNAPAG